jgi:16S rRNA (guanine527-N7)-methyltransferase
MIGEGPDGRRGRQGVRAALLRTPGVRPAELAEDRARALALTPVSRETAARLDRYVALLLDWQRRINLIAPSTEPMLWTRHIADSLQLLALAPDARIWADLGSGAGFPGLPIACALAETAGARVYLVESSAKKAAFLREAAQAAGAPVIVRNERIEDFVKNAPQPLEIVAARALAPLSDLLAAAYPLLIRGAAGFFPKGQGVDAELTEAAKCWRLQATLALSRTDPKARIVVVRGVEPVAGPRAARDSAKGRARRGGRRP